MNKHLATLTVALAWTGIAEAGPVDALPQACAKDLQTYCGNVTLPGAVRKLACLLAHEDRLDGACRYAMYDGMSMLSGALMRIDSMRKACDPDIAVHCGKDKNGLYDLNACLKNSYANFSLECQRTVDDVDPKRQ